MRVPAGLKQLIIYFFVGAAATLVEWGIFYLFDQVLSVHYTFSTVFAFALSTVANWGFGRILLFKKGDPRGLLHELLSIYGVSLAGLLANLAIMWICIEFIQLPDMLSKIIATGIVFMGNFAVRKLWIYKI